MRSYARTKSGGRFARRRRRGGCLLPLFMLTALLCAWVAWVTRDAYPLQRFIAADRSYEFYAKDFLHKRTRLAEARIWRLLPESTPLASDFATLSEKLDMPGWVLGNIAFSTFHVSGHDLDGFSDPLLISRMSRIGCLIERFHRFFGEVAHDSAGGLDLRSIDGGALFYAVRGRILLVSPNRDALIRALTLTPDQWAKTSEEAEATESGKAPDVLVRIRPAAGTALAEVFERVEIGFSTTGTAAHFDCRVQLGPAYAARLAPLLAAAKPAELLEPAGGLLEVSGNFGLKLPETWHGIERALAEDAWLEPVHDAVLRFVGGREDAVRAAFARLEQ